MAFIIFPKKSPKKNHSTLQHQPFDHGWYGFIIAQHATASQEPSMPMPSKLLDSPATLPAFRSAAIPSESWTLEPRAQVRCSMPHHPGKWPVTLTLIEIGSSHIDYIHWHWDWLRFQGVSGSWESCATWKCRPEISVGCELNADTENGWVLLWQFGLNLHFFEQSCDFSQSLQPLLSLLRVDWFQSQSINLS